MVLYELYGFPPQWGLPSISYECLKVITYFKVAKVPFVYIICDDPGISPTKNLPLFRDPSEGSDFFLFGSAPIIDYISLKGYKLSSELTNEQNVDMNAYISLIEGPMHDLLFYQIWVDAENYHYWTIPIYASLVGYKKRSLLRTYKLTKERRKILEKLDIFIDDDILEDTSKLGEKMVFQYQRILRILDSHFQNLNNRYFLQTNEPTLVDIILYAQLSLLWGLPFPNPLISTEKIEKDYPYIYRAFFRFRRDFFTISSINVNEEKSLMTMDYGLEKPSLRKMIEEDLLGIFRKSESDDDFTLKKRPDLTFEEKEALYLRKSGRLCVIGSSIFAICYIFWMGIVTISRNSHHY